MNIFIDTEDMEERYGEELYKDYLKEQNKELQEKIDKAIKYIIWYKTSNNDSNLGLTKLECEALINILKGEKE